MVLCARCAPVVLLVFLWASQGSSLGQPCQHGGAGTGQDQLGRVEALAGVRWAAEALRLGEGHSAIEALAAVPVAERGWEWKLLAKQSKFAPLRVAVKQLDFFRQPALVGSGLEEGARRLLEGGEAREMPEKIVRRRGSVEVRIAPKLSGNSEHEVEIWVDGVARQRYESNRFSLIQDAWISDDQSVVMILGTRLNAPVISLQREGKLEEADPELVEKAKDDDDEAALYLFPTGYEFVEAVGEAMHPASGVPSGESKPLAGYGNVQQLKAGLFWHDARGRQELSHEGGEGGAGDPQSRLADVELPLDPLTLLNDVHGRVVWGCSATGRFFWFRAYDRLESVDHFCLVDVRGARVTLATPGVFREFEPRSEGAAPLLLRAQLVRSPDLSEDETLLAVYEVDNGSVLLIDLSEGELIKQIPLAAGSRARAENADLLVEFSGVPDRIMIAGTLYRKSDLKPMIDLSDYAFSPEGNLALYFRPASFSRSAELGGDENCFQWVEVIRGIHGAEHQTLADRLREVQLAFWKE